MVWYGPNHLTLYGHFYNGNTELQRPWSHSTANKTEKNKTCKTALVWRRMNEKCEVSNRNSGYPCEWLCLSSVTLELSPKDKVKHLSWNSCSCLCCLANILYQKASIFLLPKQGMWAKGQVLLQALSSAITVDSWIRDEGELSWPGSTMEKQAALWLWFPAWVIAVMTPACQSRLYSWARRGYIYIFNAQWNAACSTTTP